MENWVIGGTCFYHIPFFFSGNLASLSISQTSGQQHRSVYHFPNKPGAFIVAFSLEGTLFPAAVEFLFSYALTVQ